MGTVNKVQILGNLGHDVELVTTNSGKSVANLRVATSFKDNTQWHNVVLWEKDAHAANNYLSKGSPVYIDGRLETDKYVDKDGIEKYSTKIICSNLTLIGGGGNGKFGETGGDTLGQVLNEDETPF